MVCLVNKIGKLIFLLFLKGILPFFPTKNGDKRLLDITVRHLLQHSGGWDRDVAGDPVFYKNVGKVMNVKEPVTGEILISYMMNEKLQFKPGSRYCYSNFGYVILGRIIERIMGVSYEDYVKSFLNDIGIDDMKIGKTRYCETSIEEVEYFSNPLMGPIVNKSIYDGDDRDVLLPYGTFCLEYGDSDGGWLSTTKSLVQFLMNLESERDESFSLLSKKLFKEMMKKPKFKNIKQDTCWYGMGVDVLLSKSYQHTGHLDGSTSIALKSDKGYYCGLLANYWPFESDYSGLLCMVLNGIEQMKYYSLVENFYRWKKLIVFNSQRFLLCIKVKLNDLKELNDFIRLNFNKRLATISCLTINDETYCSGFWTKDSSNASIICSSENIDKEIIKMNNDGFQLIYAQFISNSNCYLLLFKGQGRKRNIIRINKRRLNSDNNEKNRCYSSNSSSSSSSSTNNTATNNTVTINQSVCKIVGKITLRKSYHQLGIDQASFDKVLSSPHLRLISVTFQKELYCVVYEKIEREEEKEEEEKLELKKDDEEKREKNKRIRKDLKTKTLKKEKYYRQSKMNRNFCKDDDFSNSYYNQYVEFTEDELEYDKKFKSHSRYGRMLSYLFFSETGDKMASVWNDSGSFYFSAEREMSKYQLITDCCYLYENGYNPLSMTSYIKDNCLRFACIFYKIPRKRKK